MNRLLQYILTIVVALAFSLSASAQPDVSRKIDHYINAEMQKQKIPGVSLAVVRNGKIAILKSYGLADVEHRIPVKPETVFQSGSMGKQFTAAAIMILVEEGKITLDEKISKYLTDVPASWNNITVRHLLTHTAGLGDYPSEVDLRRDYTEDEYFSFIKKSPFLFETGTKWDYSNIGYVTLGVLIRRITGKFYGDFLQERIFKPLGMTTTRVISEADIVPNRASGYRVVAGELKNQEWDSPSTNTTADGSLYLTILDLAKWDAALYTDKPLKQSSLAQIWSPARLNDGTPKGYGFGWFTDELHGHRIVFHGGAWQGFKSFIIRFPNERLTLIMLANSWNAKDFKLARGLAAIFHPEFSLPQGFETGLLEDREPEVIALVRTTLLQFARGAVNPEIFTADFREKDFRERTQQLAATLNSLSLPVAVIHMSELIERRDEQNLRVYRYLLTDIGKSLSCTVKLTSDNKIAALELSQL